MAKMKAAMAAVLVMEKEGISQAFGVPGAAINPLYAALRERQGIAHILARHVRSDAPPGGSRAATDVAVRRTTPIPRRQIRIRKPFPACRMRFCLLRNRV